MAEPWTPSWFLRVVLRNSLRSDDWRGDTCAGIWHPSCSGMWVYQCCCWRARLCGVIRPTSSPAFPGSPGGAVSSGDLFSTSVLKGLPPSPCQTIRQGGEKQQNWSFCVRQSEWLCLTIVMWYVFNGLKSSCIPLLCFCCESAQCERFEWSSGIKFSLPFFFGHFCGSPNSGPHGYSSITSW